MFLSENHLLRRRYFGAESIECCLLKRRHLVKNLGQNIVFVPKLYMNFVFWPNLLKNALSFLFIYLYF